MTSVAVALAVPGVALGTLNELGLTATQLAQTKPTQPTPSCPANPCLAVSRTTGVQVKVGPEKSVVTVPRDGTIVAWSITLGNPGKKQIAFFDANEGGPSSAGLAILRGGNKLQYRLLAQSPIVALQPFFGMTAQFALAQTIPVKKGNVVALTVPTWAPALALGFGNDVSWRASRPKGKCSDTTTQTTHTNVGSVVQYICLYRTARLTYSATLVSTP
ncbi:MAG: hypothetical protein QOF77_1153 [Solirubrobacteraceae bacterium]|jgi:hypothetical protein|nr:hypothetical protein [Solirubrobacteraceae bacterium]